MPDNVNVVSPIEVLSDSKSRVAYDFMKFIGSHESSKEVTKNREYWLRLYSQCYKAADGRKIQDVLA